MPPIDPNQLPLFLDPTNPSGKSSRSIGDTPAFTQQNVDLSNLLTQNVETLAMMTDQLLHNLDGIGDLFDRNTKSVDRMSRSYDSIGKSAKNQLDYAQRQHDLDKKRDSLLDKIQKTEKDAARGKVDALRQQFRLGEMLDKQGQIQYAQGRDLKSMSVQEFLNAPEQQKQAIRDQLAQRRATHANPGASIKDALAALSRGDIGSAVAEALQPTAYAGRFTEPLVRRGEVLAERGGIIGRGSSLLVGRALPLLFTPAVVYGIQREIRQGLRAYQADLRGGMQGGLQGSAAVRETFGANLRARGQGLNPFDALTTQMALEIAHGIQSEGFTGPIRAAWQDSVTDVVKSTGMDAAAALQLMSTSANTLGQTANQFRSDMGLVELTAQKTSISISAAAKSFQEMQTAFFARGGTPSTAPVGILSTTLQTALPRNIVLGGRLTGAIAQNWQQLVARAGINPALAFEPQIIAQATKVLDSVAAMLWRVKNSSPLFKNMPLQQWVTYMEAASPSLFEALLPGAQNADIVAFMKTGRNGGFEKAQTGNAAAESKASSGTPHKHHGLFGGLWADVQAAESANLRGVGHTFDWLTGGKNSTSFSRGLYSTARAIDKEDIDVGRYRQNLVRNFRRQLAGFDPAEQQQILAPIRGAGSLDELNRAVDRAQTILIKMHPNAVNMFTAEPANVQRYYDHARGRSTPQGLVRPVR